MPSLITLAEFHLYTGTDLSVAGFTEGYLAPASQAAQDYCGTDFDLQTITREKRRSKMTLDQDLHVDFRIKPVVSVSRIALSWGNDTDNESELSLDCMDLFLLEGYALLPFTQAQACAGRINRSSTGVGWLTMGDEYITVSNYVGGDVLSESVKKAIALLAWEDYLVKGQISQAQNPGAGTIKSYSIGQYSESYGAMYEGSTKLPGTLGWGTALAQQAEKLLLPYIQSGCAGVI